MTTVSCIKDPVEVEGEKVILDISTKGLLYGDTDDADNVITSVRIMAFYYAGKLATQEYYDVPINETDPPVNISMELDPGRYDFVFIINENSEGSRLTQILDAYDGNRTINDIYGEYFASSALQNSYPIPMTQMVRDVLITGDNEIKVAGDPVETPWTIKVVRAGIRVDLVMQTQFESMKEWFTELRIANVPNKVYLFNRDGSGQTIYNVTDAASFESSGQTYRKFAYNQGDLYEEPDELQGKDVDYTITATTDQVEFEEKNGKWYWYKRLILPETLFTPAETSSQGVQLQAVVNNKIYTLTLSNQAETDFTLPRNSRYRVNGTLKTDYIEFSVGVIDWETNTNVEIPLE